MDKARRYNKGKIRYELISHIGLKELAQVYTKGAEKYTLYNDDGSIREDGANNWRKGMSWTDTIASVKRHIADWEEGEDYDELGTKHLANAAWGLITLLDYYKTFPQGDDRPHSYLQQRKIGLDIDHVICNWEEPWRERFGYPECAKCWNFSYDNYEHFKSFTPEELEEFYLNLPREMDPADIPFEPHCYITSRSIPVELTKRWIQKNGFPTVPVYTVPFGESKVEVAKKSGIDIFVDDRYENFVELNKAGVCCFLWDKPHNQRYEVGYKRLYNLKQLM